MFFHLVRLDTKSQFKSQTVWINIKRMERHVVAFESEVEICYRKMIDPERNTTSGVQVNSCFRNVGDWARCEGILFGIVGKRHTRSEMQIWSENLPLS